MGLPLDLRLGIRILDHGTGLVAVSRGGELKSPGAVPPDSDS